MNRVICRGSRIVPSPTAWPFSGLRSTETNKPLNLQPKTTSTAGRSRILANFFNINGCFGKGGISMTKENQNHNRIEKVKNTDHYKAQYYDNFVDKWDELIDWDGRAKGEGAFFIQLL